MNYDPISNIISWEISKKGKIKYVREVGRVIIHLTAAGKPVLIEIFEVDKRLWQNLSAKELKQTLIALKT